MLKSDGATERRSDGGGSRSRVELELCGEELWLLGQRAIVWPRLRALIVADVHFGKVETFHEGGIPVPRGVNENTLQRLEALLIAFDAQRLFVLGDLLHARAAQRPHAIELLSLWRSRHRDVAITLVRGNHDRAAGDPPPALSIECVDEPFRFDPLTLCHDPAAARRSDAGAVLAGHVHPRVSLVDRDDTSVGGACFWLHDRTLILPAFGAFTGAARVRPGPGDRVFVVNGEHIVDVKL